MVSPRLNSEEFAEPGPNKGNRWTAWSGPFNACLPFRLQELRHDDQARDRGARIATRYDRCPTVFFSAIALATTVPF